MDKNRVLEIWESMTQYDDPITFVAAIEAALLEGKVPDGEVVAGTGSTNDLVVIKWTSDYHPKIGDKIYAWRQQC